MDDEKKPLLVVCGPTASGKTGLSVRLAQELGGEIVSADSMQIYRGMRIGTARPTREEMQGIPHHLLGFLEPDRFFSVAQYAAAAREVIAGIHSRGALPILTGGTGLYIQAVTDNIQFEEASGCEAYRSRLTELADRQGNQALWDMLSEVDPGLAAKLHPNNRGRIIRGLEVFHMTGTPLSRLQPGRTGEDRYRLCMLGITFSNRDCLYQRINRRVDLMVRDGLLEEARSLFRRDFAGTASQAIGYKELLPYFRGDCSLEEALEHLKMQTRRYAKRQLTWFRRDSRIHWLLADSLGEAGLFPEAAAVARERLQL